MNEKKDYRQTLTSFLSEISPGTGLKLWLFFLFCFYFLNYPIPYSILLSFAGGLAGAWVQGWWNYAEESIDAPPETEKIEEELEQQPERAYRKRSAKRRRGERDRKRSEEEGFFGPFKGFFDKPNRLPRSRRR